LGAALPALLAAKPNHSRLEGGEDNTVSPWFAPDTATAGEEIAEGHGLFWDGLLSGKRVRHDYGDAAQRTFLTVPNNSWKE
jgi:hypothetical protein